MARAPILSIIAILSLQICNSAQAQNALSQLPNRQHLAGQHQGPGGGSFGGGGPQHLAGQHQGPGGGGFGFGGPRYRGGYGGYGYDGSGPRYGGGYGYGGYGGVLRTIVVPALTHTADPDEPPDD